MDSLRPSLAQALPPNNAFDPEQDLQNPFRAAALGIATFYRKASETSRKAHSLGYSAGLQDVLEYLQAELDHSNEAPSKHKPENRMAVTIERVMDYIERRQESLRGEIDSGDEDVSNHANTTTIPTPQSAVPSVSHPPTQVRHHSTTVPLVRPAGRRSSPRRTHLPVSMEQPIRHTPAVATSSSPVLSSFEFPVPTFPFNFDAGLPTATVFRGTDRHSSNRRSGRKGKGRDRDRCERNGSSDVVPSPSASVTQVTGNNGYNHYGVNANVASDIEVGSNGLNKRRYNTNVFGEESIEPMLIDSERASKRLTRR